MPKPAKRSLSPELVAMLQRSEKARKGPAILKQGVDLKLERAANRKLAKSGFFPRPDNNQETPVIDAEGIGTHGLRPTWHGRV